MANPQLENGHTRIANELLEALARVRIPGEERSIIDAVFRKTYGWHKCEDSISLGQLSKSTGMTRSNCARALKRCVLSRMITRVIKGDSTSCNVLKINKNYEEWVLSELIPRAIKTANRGAINVDTHKRKNIQKKSNIYVHFESFWKSYPHKVGKKSALKSWNSAKDKPPLADILLAVDNQKAWRDSANGAFRPAWKNPATWINQGCWDDVLDNNYGKDESYGTRRGFKGDYRKVDVQGEISREDSEAIERARRNRQERLRNKGINQPADNSN